MNPCPVESYSIGVFLWGNEPNKLHELYEPHELYCPHIAYRRAGAIPRMARRRRMTMISKTANGLSIGEENGVKHGVGPCIRHRSVFLSTVVQVWTGLRISARLRNIPDKKGAGHGSAR